MIDTTLIVIAVCLFLWMLIVHRELGPGDSLPAWISAILGTDHLPRWLAYVLGLAPILLAFCLVQALRPLPETGGSLADARWQAIIDLWVLAILAAIPPTLGRIWQLFRFAARHDEAAAVAAILDGEEK